MELEAAKCPNCGANIELDPKKTFFVCGYCGANISVKNAITAYKEEQKKEYRLKIADECLEKGIIDDAEEIYRQISKNYPNEYRGWWGIIRCSPAITEYFLEPMDGEYERAIAFASEGVRAEIEEHRRKRLEIIDKTIETIKRRESLTERLRKMPAQIDNSKENSVILKENVEALEGSVKALNEKTDDIANVCIPKSEKRIKKLKTGSYILLGLSMVVLLIGIIAGEVLMAIALVVALILVAFMLSNFEDIKEQKKFLQKLEAELAQKTEEKKTAELNLAEVRSALEKEQEKTAGLEAEMEKIKAELSEC